MSELARRGRTAEDRGCSASGRSPHLGAHAMTDLQAVAIWLAVILLLSLATIPVCARWRKR